MATSLSHRWKLSEAEFKSLLAEIEQEPDPEKRAIFETVLAQKQYLLIPELYDDAARIIKLWTQLDSVKDVFTSEKPETVSELLNEAWHLSHALRRMQLFVDKSMHSYQNVLAIAKEYASTNETYPQPEISGPFSEQELSWKQHEGAWLNFLRIFIGIFNNYIARGETSEPITIRFHNRSSGDLIVETENQLASSIPQKSTKTFSPLHGYRGTDVINFFCKRLGGSYSGQSNAKSFIGVLTLKKRYLLTIKPDP